MMKPHRPVQADPNKICDNIFICVFDICVNTLVLTTKRMVASGKMSLRKLNNLVVGLYLVGKNNFVEFVDFVIDTPLFIVWPLALL